MNDNLLKEKIASVNQKIRSMRHARQYSQRHLAQKMDISQQSYSKIEQGINPITVEHLLKLSLILDIDIEILLAPRATTINKSLSLFWNNRVGLPAVNP